MRKITKQTARGVDTQPEVGSLLDETRNLRKASKRLRTENAALVMAVDRHLAKCPPHADNRIAALEAEVAELKGFLPMLGRMGFYEVWSGHSIPDHVVTIEETLLSAARAQLSLYEDILSPGSCRLAEIPGPVEPELVRPKDEQLPAAAQAIHDANEDRFQRECKEAAAGRKVKS